MDDFLFTVEIVKAEILEDYRKYLPGTNPQSTGEWIITCST